MEGVEDQKEAVAYSVLSHLCDSYIADAGLDGFLAIGTCCSADCGHRIAAAVLCMVARLGNDRRGRAVVATIATCFV